MDEVPQMLNQSQDNSLSAPNRAEPRLRAALDDDASEVCAFLSKFMGRRGLPAEQYLGLFTYPWMSDPPDRGFLLESEGNVVGYHGAVYAERRINGRTVRFCNLTNWCVAPEFRQYSLHLIFPLLKLKDTVFTNFSPAPEVQPVFLRLGFQVLDRFKWFAVPGGNLASLMNRRRAYVLTSQRQVEESLEGVELQAFRDHQGTGCQHTLVAEENRQLYVISRKRKRKGLTFSEILYASTKDMLQRHFESVKASVLLRDRTFVLACDERLYGRPPHCALRYERVTLVKGGEIDPSLVDNLYSELAVL